MAGGCKKSKKNAKKLVGGVSTPGEGVSAPGGCLLRGGVSALGGGLLLRVGGYPSMD